MGAGAAGAGPSADVMVQTGPCAPGELRSLAELLEEVKDGDDREDREDVTVGRDTRGEAELSRWHSSDRDSADFFIKSGQRSLTI